MFRITGYAPDDHPDQQILFQMRYLTPGYFKAFNIAILAGRNLTATQISNNESRIVIDENMAKLLFPDMPYQDIIGKAVNIGLEDVKSKPLKSIINGVAATIQSRVGSMNPIKTPAVYFSQLNMERNLAFTVTMPQGKILTSEMISMQISKQFPRLKNLQVTSLHARWNEQTLSERLSLWLVLTMTFLTLFLAAIGLAGLTQMTTHHKKYELAVRMATGATQMRLLNYIFKDAFWILVLGLGMGFIISVLAYQQVREQLDLLPEFNWLAMTVLDLGVILIVLLSVMIPAWRVISADPMKALKEE
jgi:ABC-type antimicrobial peptide transport system permease subunit